MGSREDCVIANLSGGGEWRQFDDLVQCHGAIISRTSLLLTDGCLMDIGTE
jgi:hypothetical protein